MLDRRTRGINVVGDRKMTCQNGSERKVKGPSVAAWSRVWLHFSYRLIVCPYLRRLG